MSAIFAHVISADDSVADTRKSPSNIILILADDMGYGDVQALNPDSTIPTPSLNRLAGEGMTFTDAHSPSAVCTPTRYATLTGRYCWRTWMKRGVLNGYGEPLIQADRVTIASHLQSAGYHTAVIGKWHLGLGFQKDESGKWDWTKPVTDSPIDHGFDSSLVIPASLDFPPYVYVDGHQITGLPDRIQPAKAFPEFLRRGELGSDFSIEDCLDRLTEKACGHIAERSKADQPFFLYFPLTAPHKPVMPHSRFKGQSKLGPYGDFVMQVDWTVGQVLDAIDQAGITDNTMVIYTSDNGSFMYRSSDQAEPSHKDDASVQGYFQGDHKANGPLRGTKADIWEAGHRVPFFVRLPGVTKPGSKTDKTICHVDVFATAAEIAGSKLPSPKEAAPDSFSFLPLLKGDAKNHRRAAVVHHSGGGMFAIRRDQWKLVLGTGSGGRQQPKGQKFATPWQLYDLSNDIGETQDRFQSERPVADALAAELFQFLDNEASR